MRGRRECRDDVATKVVDSGATAVVNASCSASWRTLQSWVSQRQRTWGLQNQTSLSLLLLAGSKHGSRVIRRSAGGLRTFLLLLLRGRVPSGEATTAGRRSWVQAFSLGDNSVDSSFEDLVDTGHLFTTALHVEGAHLLGDSLALVVCDGGKSLSSEEVDAGTLVAQVGLETKENDGGGGAEMEDFRIPLCMC